MSRKKKSKPAGYITARWSRHEFTPTGVNELGQPVAPLIISGKTYYYTREAGEHLLAKIEARNRELSNPTIRDRPYKERAKENIRVSNIIRSGAKEELRRVRQANFFARMPAIVEGMQYYLRNPTPRNKAMVDALTEFINKFESLKTEQAKAQFYYENQEYFEDMTDYYQWLKEHSGRSGADVKPSKKYKGDVLSSYIASNLMTIRKITKRLDDYV